MLKKEWKNLFNNKFLLIAVVAVITVPMIYTNLFLRSMWDPYGSLENLPVAIVNNDKPVEYNGETMSIGKDMVDELKEDKSLDFDFVDADKAQKGLEKNDYYMVVTIPQDFSKNATTVLDDNPQKMVLDYKTNPAKNYIASKLSETAFNKMKTSVTESVTKVYTETLFENMDKISDGFDKAYDGAVELNDGSKKLLDGNKTITDNLKVLADSTLEFKNGMNDFSVGLNQYIDGVNTVNSSISQLKDGTNQLASGSTELSQGIEKLHTGASDFNQAVSQYTTGVDTANAGSSALKSGVLEYTDAVKKISGASNLIVSKNEELTQKLDILSSSTNTLVSNNTALNNGVESISKGVNGIYGGIQQISQIVNSNSQENQKIIDNNNALIEQINNNQSLSQEEKDNLISIINQNNSIASQNSSEAKLQQVKMVTDNLLPVAEQVKVGIDGNESVSGLKQSINKYTEATNTLNDSISNQLVPNIKLYTSSTGELNKAINQLSQNNDKINGGVNALDSGLKTLSQNSSKLVGGSQQIYSGIDLLNQKSPELVGGVNKLNEGANLLNQGSNLLVSKNGELLNGLNKLSDASVQLNDGSVKLKDGSVELGNGLTTLKDGTNTLADKLKEGKDEINDVNTKEVNSDMFANPIEENHTQQTVVKNNGYAMAPYMMSVGLWVACIAFSIIYPICKYEGQLKSGFKWWFSKASVLAIISCVSALLMVWSLGFFNGLTPNRLGDTILIAVLASIAFMSILYFFNALLGKIGSFIMLIYMVVQLSGSAGTYPVEISGEFVPYINKYLPFTYTVNAFRNTISGEQSVVPCIVVLVSIIVIFSVLTLLLFNIKAKKINNNKETFFDYLEEKGLA